MEMRRNLSNTIATIAMISYAFVRGAAQVTDEIEPSPPKLDQQQSERDVWFLALSAGQSQKFSLKCQASGNPDRYQWFKDGLPFHVDGERVIWRRPGQSGTIEFLRPQPADKGLYQCRVSNIFGTAVSDIFRVNQGVLDHFPQRSLNHVSANEGESLTVKCQLPYGDPKPSVLWLYRNTKQAFVIETVKRPHITVDGDGNLQFSYVEAHDARENLVYQCAASSPVLQGEYRTGDETKLSLIPKDRIHPRAPHMLWCSPEHINVTAGHELRLTCIFGGFPLPKVHWSKDDSELPNDRLKHDDFGKTLIVSPVLASDQGTYVCRAGAVMHRMYLTVTAAPHWAAKGGPDDLTLPEDANAEMECDVAGEPKPFIEWSLNGLSLSEVTSNPRRTMTNNGATLKIVNLDHDVDTGVYQCNASNALGYVFANAYLNVLAHAPRFLTPVDQLIKVTVGSLVSLDCAVDAAPAANIRWLDKKERPITSQGRLRIFDDNSLEIFNAQLNDQGNYYCNVSNKYGLHRAVRKLKVYLFRVVTSGPTIFLSTLSERGNAIGDETHFEVGADVELSCTAEADERLSIEYSWLLNERQIDFADTAFLQHESNRIQVKGARGRHSGLYKCIAKTEVDELVSSLKVVVRDVPEAPKVIAIDCNDRRASVQWQAPFNNFNAIRQYVVEYRTGFHPDRWLTALVEENPRNQETFEAILTLSPWVNYTFRVSALNSYGRSSYGAKADLCNTPPSYPYANPANVTAQGDEPDNLIVFWSPMEKEEWNAEDFRYFVKYRFDEPGAPWRNLTIEDPLADRAIIRQQPTFQRYIVQVIAVNAIGPSVEDPKNVVGYSGEDVPLEAPENVRINQIINSTTMMLAWNHVQPQSVRGHFQGYKIRIWKTSQRFGLNEETDFYTKRHSKPDPTSLNQLPDVLVEPSSNLAAVNILKPMHSYLLQVLAFNSKHEGPLSQNVQLTMPEGAPSELADLKAESPGSATVLTTWQPPFEENGIIRGYYLSYLKERSGEVEETFVPPTVRHHVYDAGDPETNYVVSVWAETGGGQGPKRTQVVKTWPVIAPAVPNFTIEVLNHESAKISWLPPNNGEMPGSKFFLNYSIASTLPDQGSIWKQTEAVWTPEKSIVLQGLEADKDYQLILVAADGDLETPSMAAKLKTPKYLVRGQVLAGENLANATWFISIICAIAVAFVSLLVICICQHNKGGKYPVKKKELERGHHLDADEERSFMEYQYGMATSTTSDQKATGTALGPGPVAL